jgi:hypothetical protein
VEWRYFGRGMERTSNTPSKNKACTAALACSAVHPWSGELFTCPVIDRQTYTETLTDGTEKQEYRYANRQIGRQTDNGYLTGGVDYPDVIERPLVLRIQAPNQHKLQPIAKRRKIPLVSHLYAPPLVHDILACFTIPVITLFKSPRTSPYISQALCTCPRTSQLPHPIHHRTYSYYRHTFRHSSTSTP